MDSSAQPKSSLLAKMRSSFSVGRTPMTSSTPVVPATVAPVSLPIPQLSTSDALNVLDAVLTGVEQQAAMQQQTSVQPPQQMGMVAQATPVALDQVAADVQAQQTAQYAGPAAKETISTAANYPAVETATSMQYVEAEKAPEIPPEVSEYLQHVEDHASQAPQEIVVAEPQQQTPLATHYPKQSVVILPITPELEKTGQRKGPRASLRWLVEFSRKLMKMFSGQVIYREVQEQH